MSAGVFEVRGWCPGALRPMASGDGLIVRIRPRGSSLDARQADGLVRAATRHGNGRIDMTNRANLQVRGVRPGTLDGLLADLAALDLVDTDTTAESRRNIVVTPFRAGIDGAETERIAAALETAVTAIEGLPGKFGFAVDTGPRPVLAGTPADIRLERSADGALIVRPDGLARGRTVSAADAVSTMIDLARWFVASGGAREGRGRMARHLEEGAVLPWADDGRERDRGALPLEHPARAEALDPEPGLHPEGALVAVAFGALDARQLAALAALGHPLRITPWRMLLVVGVRAVPAIDGLVTRPDDPLLRVTACPGAPACPQAFAPTRALAASLAPDVPPGRHLHVSGCAKGCALATPAAVTLIATASGFDLVRDGRASDVPVRRALGEGDIRRAAPHLFEAG